MMVTKMKLAVVVLAVGLAVAGAGTASFHALAGEPAARTQREPGSSPAKPTPAQARVKQLKKQINKLTQDLQRAEEEAARERAVPPRQTPVAVIFGNVPITRDELADHLLSRMSAKQLDGYVNRRIIEQACKKADIIVTNAEVDEYLKKQPKGTLFQPGFLARLREQHMTLQQWKEDVVRPQLMLEKLIRSRGPITEKELRRAYEERYGEKVECHALILASASRATAEDIARRLRTEQTSFEQEAARAHPQKKVVPFVVNRHHRGARELEKAAFALEPGEVSQPIELDRAWIILRCKRRIRADRAPSFEDVRDRLKSEVAQRRAKTNSGDFFKELKAQARVKLLWTPPEDSERSK
jgi:hypothetical protein